MNKRERNMWEKIGFKLALIQTVIESDIDQARKDKLIAHIKEIIHDEKLEIRRYKRYNEVLLKSKMPYSYMTPSYFSGDYDSATCIYKLPYVVNDSQREQIKDALVQYCTPSQYDCTGQWFTVSLKIFTTPTTTFIYHYLCCDV